MVNAVSPGALTRMTANLGNRPEAPAGEWNPRDPDNIAPIVVWLGSGEARGITGRVFQSSGGRLGIAEGWSPGPMKEKDGRWDPAELSPVVAELIEKAEPPFTFGGGRRA
jgi:hypothetical protein